MSKEQTKQENIDISETEQIRIDKILKKHRYVLYLTGMGGQGIAYDQYDVATAIKQYSDQSTSQLQQENKLLNGCLKQRDERLSQLVSENTQVREENKELTETKQAMAELLNDTNKNMAALFLHNKELKEQRDELLKEMKQLTQLVQELETERQRLSKYLRKQD